MASLALTCPMHACSLLMQAAKPQCCSQTYINIGDAPDMMCRGQISSHHVQQGMCCCSWMQAALAGSTAPGPGA